MSIVPKKLVSIILDPDSDDEPIYCTYDIDGKFTKIRDLEKILGAVNNDVSKSKNASSSKIKDSIDRFFRLDLPYIAYHDVNPFELMDDECDSLNTRIFLNGDTILERDRIIGNEIGLKSKRERVERPVDHHYLPGKPDLVYEGYPFFKPNKDASIELTNEEFYHKFVNKFENLLRKKFKSKEGKQQLKDIDFENYISDLPTYQTPVDYPNYFTLYENEFFDVFNDRIFNPILGIYSKFILNSSTKLKKYLLETDESYEPVLNRSDNVSLKPIGSVASSSFPFGISDPDTNFLNALFVHVEIVNLSLGIGEGYELYFQSKKQNYQTQEGTYNKKKIVGPDSTKIDNFLKYFTKCVAICLNSHTNRFIITDYYWVGVFQIEDVEDGEIYNVKKLISKVNVVHFSYSNFENNEQDYDGLSIRSIIASWFNVSSDEYLSINERIHSVNKKVIKEWELFKKSNGLTHLQNNNNTNNSNGVNKRLKFSPFIYTTPSEIKFIKQKVDLEKSLFQIIAIGYEWSCQTLCVDLKKLFMDKQHYFKILNEKKLNNVTKKVLISVYDQQYDNDKFKFSDYYRDDKKLITNKHGGIDSLFGLPLKDVYDESFARWNSSVEIYSKLQKLQGDVIAKVLDFGYLEDKPYNETQLHFKTDGYYIIYDPISPDFKDLLEIDINDEKIWELSKETLNKIHENGVTFQPHTIITLDIMRLYQNKVYVINLEETTSTPTSTSTNSFKNYKAQDLIDLDNIFKKMPPSKRRGSNAMKHGNGVNGKNSKLGNGRSGSRKSSIHNHSRNSSLNHLLQHLSQGEFQPSPGTILDDDDIEAEAFFSDDEEF